MKIKTWIALCLFAIISLSVGGCKNPSETGSSSEENMVEVIASDYEKPKLAANMSTWTKEVVDNSGKISNVAVENGVVVSPYFDLTVNGTKVPVYTSRCYTSPHNFARIDVKGAPETFKLEVVLRTKNTYTAVVVLPEKRNVTANVAGNKVTAELTAYGDYSFAFETSDKKVSAVYNQPFTLFVSPEEPLAVPEGWNEVTVEAGKHTVAETTFTAENTVYRLAKGVHEVSHLRLPSNSILYLDRGAYVLGYWDGVNRGPVIGSYDTENVKVSGRGIIDFSAVPGGQDKPKEVIVFERVRNVLFDGLTLINPHSWTLQFYASTDVEVSHVMQFGYRNYSDGIMFAECRDCTAHHNFYRTGDDAFEVKGMNNRQGDKPDDQKMRGYHIVFEENSSWMDRTCSFGVTYENYAPFENVVFRNNSIGFATAVWGEYNSCLDVRLGARAGTVWKNITFENIEIYESWSVGMTIQFYNQGGFVEDVTFKNISIKRSPQGRAAIIIACASGILDEISMKNIVFENIDFCGKKLTADSLLDNTLVRFVPNTAALRAEVTVR